MNPFKHGQVVTEDDFCPRPALEEDLNNYISSAQNVLLEGERRFGKTSLIHETVRRIAKLRLLYIDILEIKTVSDFCRRVINAIASMDRKAGLSKRVFQAVSHLKPVLSIDSLTGAPSLSLDASVKMKPDYIEGLMDLIEDEGKRKKMVVVFDEFQDILNLPDSAEALAILRGKVQFHASIPYIFAGSVRNQMDDIFNNPDSAFFKSAVTLNVGELKREEFAAFLRRKFDIEKRVVQSSVLEKMFEIAMDVPGDVQQFCAAVWDVTSLGESVADDVIPRALELIYSRELKGYEAALNLVTGQQLRCLMGLARRGGKSPLSAGFIQTTGISQPASVKKALNRLIKLKIIYKFNREYKFINPFFKAWLLHKNF